MEVTDIIAGAKASGQKALSEHASKQILAAYGVPVVQEVVAKDTAEACAAAEDMGFPVVLKGLGSTLLHKTERGLVHLNLTGRSDVLKAAQAIEREAKDELEGILVQPQLAGRREFVAGISRDPVFGPAVMFGIGGVFTEALSDIALRIAPLSERDAGEMLREITSHRLLGPFRGEKAADREALVQT
ncbi:MAG TPA: acetate--CoA ligase family protein, partial [Desulfomonilia bacterium]|nr:acetate--CoA ligase family protein [Desulfomonilia bacterium]